MTGPAYPPSIVELGDLAVTLRAGAGGSLDVACGGCGLVHRMRFAITAEQKVAVDVYPMAQLTIAHRQATNR